MSWKGRGKSVTNEETPKIVDVVPSQNGFESLRILNDPLVTIDK